MKQTYTTGEVAKICHVTQHTVANWFDAGKLKGYRVPGRKDRRIPRESLLHFLREHGLPLDGLEEEAEAEEESPVDAG